MYQSLQQCVPCSFILLAISLAMIGCKPSDPTPASNSTISDELGSLEAPSVSIPSDDGAATDTDDAVASTDIATDSAEDATTEDAASEDAASDNVAATDDPADTATDDATDTEAATEPDAAATDTAASTDRVVSGDWRMWGGDVSRNMVNTTTGISFDIEPAIDAKDGKQLLWTARLGSQAYANPVIANGKIYSGTNNGAQYRPQHEGDRGCLLCFDSQTGEFLWQLTREKLPLGRVVDWPEQGICSTPFVEGDRVYVVTNRAELMCLDAEGFRDGENDGPYQEETDKENEDADIIWVLDMIEDLGVFPHNLATSSPVIHGDTIYITTSNGVDEAHLELPAPRAPSFLAVDKNTGELRWEDNTPYDRVLHGQWGSPAIGVVDGRAQVYFPGGDGWVYALDAETGEHIWKFDCNPKDSKWELQGRGTRNALIATPVFFENSVIIAVGQDPEHGEGTGHLWRIDATKKGDISPTLVVTADGTPKPHEDLPAIDTDAGDKVIENTNSGAIWHYGGEDEDGSITGEQGSDVFRRTISTVAVSDGLVYVPDLSGFLHCVDAKTGERVWVHDTLAAVWGSCMVVDGRVLLGDEDGELVILTAGREENVERVLTFNASIYCTPVVANGNLYLNDRSRLYAFSTTADD